MDLASSSVEGHSKAHRQFHTLTPPLTFEVFLSIVATVQSQYPLHLHAVGDNPILLALRGQTLDLVAYHGSAKRYVVPLGGHVPDTALHIK